MDEFYEWKDGAIDAQEFIRSGIYCQKHDSVRLAYKKAFE